MVTDGEAGIDGLPPHEAGPPRVAEQQVSAKVVGVHDVAFLGYRVYCAGQLDADTATRIAGDETACVGDVVSTRRNDRRLVTAAGEPVRNRDTWIVTDIDSDGSLTVSHRGRHGSVTLSADYTRAYTRLGTRRPSTASNPTPSPPGCASPRRRLPARAVRGLDPWVTTRT